MTAHDVMVQQLTTTQNQMKAYQTDICNLLNMIGDLQQEEKAIILWLSVNPE